MQDSEDLTVRKDLNLLIRCTDLITLLLSIVQTKIHILVKDKHVVEMDLCGSKLHISVLYIVLLLTDDA